MRKMDDFILKKKQQKHGKAMESMIKGRIQKRMPKGIPAYTWRLFNAFCDSLTHVTLDIPDILKLHRKFMELFLDTRYEKLWIISVNKNQWLWNKQLFPALQQITIYLNAPESSSRSEYNFSFTDAVFALSKLYQQRDRLVEIEDFRVCMKVFTGMDHPLNKDIDDKDTTKAFIQIFRRDGIHRFDRSNEKLVNDITFFEDQEPELEDLNCHCIWPKSGNKKEKYPFMINNNDK